MVAMLKILWQRLSGPHLPLLTKDIVMEDLPDSQDPTSSHLHVTLEGNLRFTSSLAMLE